MNELQFSIVINASKQKVWDTLWSDETFRQWAGIIDPGTFMKGTLKKGNQIEFISTENGYGVTSLVEEIIEGEYLLLRHSNDTKESRQKDRENNGQGVRKPID